MRDEVINYGESKNICNFFGYFFGKTTRTEFNSKIVKYHLDDNGSYVEINHNAKEARFSKSVNDEVINELKRRLED